MTAADLEFIANQSARLAASLPARVTSDLANTLTLLAPNDWRRIRLKATQCVPQTRFQDTVDAFLQAWQEHASEVSPATVAMALYTAAKAIDLMRDEQQVELVWTGPSTPSIPMRRTDQALLQVIEVAQSDLLIVSFAVYNIPTVVDALIAAGRRGVCLRICLEAPEPSGQQIAYDTIRALGQDVGHIAQLYIWPRDQRPTGATGKPASLHAKCAVADGCMLFISSANLTEYAMKLNMELGVLIKGGELPERMTSHFERLIESNTLQRFRP